MNVLAHMVIGLLIPGKTISVMAFQSLVTNNVIQDLTLIQDLKLAYYMKIPPIAMVSCQLLGTLFVNHM